MSHSRKACLDAAEEYLSAPNGSVVSVTSTIESHSQHRFLPLPPLSKNRSHVGAMMLYGKAVRGGKRCNQRSRYILRMTIMYDHELIPAYFIHRHQVANGFLKCLK